MKHFIYLSVALILTFCSISSNELYAQDSTKKTEAKTETVQKKPTTIPAGTEMMVHFDSGINTEDKDNAYQLTGR